LEQLLSLLLVPLLLAFALLFAVALLRLLAAPVDSVLSRITHLLWAVLLSVLFLASLFILVYGIKPEVAQQQLPSIAASSYLSLAALRSISSYGLFRRMTGTGPLDALGRGSVQRPEIIIETSDNGVVWHEFAMMFKPGELMRAPPFVVPLGPRIDWQMWFAALGRYQHNPWLVHLAYKILKGNLDVMLLLRPTTTKESPSTTTTTTTTSAPPTVPRYLRMSLYHYRFTSWQETETASDNSTWWQRDYRGEYLPVVQLHSFADSIARMGWLPLHVAEDQHHHQCAVFVALRSLPWSIYQALWLLVVLLMIGLTWSRSC
jgi:hypothetical protein